MTYVSWSTNTKYVISYNLQCCNIHIHIALQSYAQEYFKKYSDEARISEENENMSSDSYNYEMVLSLRIFVIFNIETCLSIAFQSYAT